MSGKSLDSLIYHKGKGNTQKSFICYIDEEKERRFLVFKLGRIYQMDSKGKVDMINSFAVIQDIFLSIENGSVKVIGSGNIGV